MGISGDERAAHGRHDRLVPRWSQDHKVIAIQYGITAIFVGVVALVLSG